MPSRPGSTGRPADREPVGEPALVAWQQVCSAAVAPDAVELVHVQPKAAVYRLRQALPDGRSVIAKCGTCETLRREHRIYRDILPHLGITTLECLGILETSDADSCWLFVEESDGEVYAPDDGEHRRLAGRWLGQLHAAASRLGNWGDLPDRSTSWYAQHLSRLRAAIRQGEQQSALTSDDRALLADVLRQCDRLERGWHRVEQACASLPATLVHVDFVSQNMRVRGGSTRSLVVFDWEMAGWGTPATDLTRDSTLTLNVASLPGLAALPDLDTYYETVRPAWTTCTRDDITEVAAFGLVLRVLLTTSWMSESLIVEPSTALSLQDVLDTLRYALFVMRFCRDMMTSVLAAVGFGD